MPGDGGSPAIYGHCREGVNSHAAMCRPYRTEIAKNVL
jgi:hypothetical protein